VGQAQYWVDAAGKVQAPVVGHIGLRNGKPTVPSGITGEIFEPQQPWQKERYRIITVEPKEGWTAVQRNQQAVSGFLLQYNATLKTIVAHDLPDIIVKKRTPYYRELYDDHKLKDREKNPNLSAGHINQRAYRWLGKIFTQHVWKTWRAMEGLPVGDPYTIAILGHKGYIPPPGESTST
jgi:hypothetical protein